MLGVGRGVGQSSKSTVCPSDSPPPGKDREKERLSLMRADAGRRRRRRRLTGRRWMPFLMKQQSPPVPFLTGYRQPKAALVSSAVFHWVTLAHALALSQAAIPQLPASPLSTRDWSSTRSSVPSRGKANRSTRTGFDKTPTLHRWHPSVEGDTWPATCSPLPLLDALIALLCTAAYITVGSLSVLQFQEAMQKLKTKNIKKNPVLLLTMGFGGCFLPGFWSYGVYHWVSHTVLVRWWDNWMAASCMTAQRRSLCSGGRNGWAIETQKHVLLPALSFYPAAMELW